jgi:hypothetical protein
VLRRQISAAKRSSAKHDCIEFSDTQTLPTMA